MDSSGGAMRGAQVECEGQLTTSGLDGSFEVGGVASCLARITAPGFEPTTVPLTSGEFARIRLKVAGTVEKVLVTATRVPARLEEVAVAANVVTAEDISRRLYPSLPEVLREVPGIHVVTTGRRGSLTSAFTRGAQRTGLLVLLDGVPVNDPGGEVNLAHLTTEELGRIEVIRGPGSALFGAEASAGTLQLFTRQGDPEFHRPRASASYERGSFSSDRWRAGLYGGWKPQLDYAFTLSQLHTGGEFPNDYYRNTSGAANVGFRVGASTELRGIFRQGDSILGVPGQTAYALIDHDAFETNRDSLLSLKLASARGPGFYHQASFGWHRMRDVYTDMAMDGPYSLAAVVRDVPGPAGNRTYLVRFLGPHDVTPALSPGMRLVKTTVWLYPLWEPYVSFAQRRRFGYQASWRRGEWVSTVGYELERQEGDVSSERVHRTNRGLFVHQQNSMGGRVFLSGGLRLERSTAYGYKLAPRVAGGILLTRSHGILSSTYLRVSAGRGITEPSLLQIYAKEFYATGNRDLKPEVTVSYEAGLVQEWLSRRVHTELSLFHNSFRDLITFVSLPAPTWGTWKNLDQSRARGVEFLARAKITPTLMASATYTRLWSRVVYASSAAPPFYGAGEELPRRPGNSASLSLAWMPKRWWVQAGAWLVGERQDGDYYLGVNRNPGYQHVYFAASYQLHPGVTPFLRIDNLLNSRYQEALGYSSLPRTVHAGVRLGW